eukprot:1380523-Pyramimonas_sp.AAC.1
MSWACDYLFVVRELFPNAVLNDLKKKFSTYTRASAFSGIDAPGVSNNVLAHALGDIMGCYVPSVPLMSAVEKDVDCRGELLSGPTPPAHMFTEIEHFWKGSVYREI